MTPTTGEACCCWSGCSRVGATRTRMIAAETTGVKPAGEGRPRVAAPRNEKGGSDSTSDPPFLQSEPQPRRDPA